MTEQAKTIEKTFVKEKSALFNFIRKFVSSREDALTGRVLSVYQLCKY